MCGRFTMVRLSDFTDMFPWIHPPEAGVPPRYNIAPGQPVAAALNLDPPRIELVRWGLVPAWADDPTIGNRLINARAESLAHKPSFSAPLRRRRCIVPASGFYEWRREADGSKTPVYITAASGKPLPFAGLWDVWCAPDGSELRTCTIITVPASPLIRQVHDRMPAILPADLCRKWLSAGEAAADDMKRVLEACAGDDLVLRPVSKLVNDPRNDVPQCIQPTGAVTGEDRNRRAPGLFDH